MKTYTEMLPHIEGNDYETHFWNAIRGKQGHKAVSYTHLYCFYIFY